MLMGEGGRRGGKQDGHATRTEQETETEREAWQDKVETCVSSLLRALDSLTRPASPTHSPSHPLPRRPSLHLLAHPRARPAIAACSCPIHGAGRHQWPAAVVGRRCSLQSTYRGVRIRASFIMEPASADGLLQSRIMLARNPLFSLGRDLGLGDLGRPHR